MLESTEPSIHFASEKPNITWYDVKPTIFMRKFQSLLPKSFYCIVARVVLQKDQRNGGNAGYDGGSELHPDISTLFISKEK